ncbi:MAG: SsrA-binding protein SmpB [Candidatus Gracilibacteria bacterium]|nr:SsrA-binding protein SmpB [Candidatus Gracilibacteria bacterium]
MGKQTNTTIAENRKALFDYEIIEEFEAGIVLAGAEAKSIRLGQVNLKGSYINTHSGRPILVGCHISEYKNNSTTKLDPKRERLLLLSQKEILRLSQKVKEMGATVVPIEIYSKGNLFKVRIALAKGRKKWEKKQVLKERDLERETKKVWG